MQLNKLELKGKVEEFEEIVWQTSSDLNSEQVNESLKEMANNLQDLMDAISEKDDVDSTLLYNLGDSINLLSNIKFTEVIDWDEILKDLKEIQEILEYDNESKEMTYAIEEATKYLKDCKEININNVEKVDELTKENLLKIKKFMENYYYNTGLIDSLNLTINYIC